MRSPSARCLPNRVTLQRIAFTPQDAGGTQRQRIVTTLATNVACAAQPSGRTRVAVGEMGLERTFDAWDVMFTGNVGLIQDDLILVPELGGSGVVHTLIVVGPSDQAGRGCAWVYTAEELV